jgi:hypothetical protein
MEYLTWDNIAQGSILICSIIGIYQNNNKKSSNFYWFMFCYSAWAVIYFQHGVYGAVIKELIFIGFNIQGLIMWRRDERCIK